MARASIAPMVTLSELSSAPIIKAPIIFIVLADVNWQPAP